MRFIVVASLALALCGCFEPVCETGDCPDASGGGSVSAGGGTVLGGGSVGGGSSGGGSSGGGSAGGAAAGGGVSNGGGSVSGGGSVGGGSSSGGGAVIMCPTGKADCNGNTTDGCEVDPSTDTANCGACGTACHLPNSTTACSAGKCVLTACDPGFQNCDTWPDNGCELQMGASCSTDLACRPGTSMCLSSWHRAQCLRGPPLPQGTTCAMGGTCGTNSVCQVPGTAVNTPCAQDAVVSPAGNCVQNRFWVTVACSQHPTGNSLCQNRGFARATAAWGYSWSECGGPNASLVAGIDNCVQYDPDRSRCLNWYGALACNQVPLSVPRFGVALQEFGGGDPTYAFDAARWWGRGCGGWNVGHSVRVSCEF